MEARLASLLRRKEAVTAVVVEGRGTTGEEEETEAEILTLLHHQPTLQRGEIEDGRNALQLALQYGRERLAGHMLDELERRNGDDNPGTVLVLSLPRPR